MQKKCLGIFLLCLLVVTISPSYVYSIQAIEEPIINSCIEPNNNSRTTENNTELQEESKQDQEGEIIQNGYVLNLIVSWGGIVSNGLGLFLLGPDLTISAFFFAVGVSLKFLYYLRAFYPFHVEIPFVDYMPDIIAALCRLLGGD